MTGPINNNPSLNIGNSRTSRGDDTTGSPGKGSADAQVNADSAGTSTDSVEISSAGVQLNAGDRSSGVSFASYEEAAEAAATVSQAIRDNGAAALAAQGGASRDLGGLLGS